MSRILTLLVFLVPVFVTAQATFKGSVKDGGNGDPLIGANVIIEGTSQGSQTDIDGNFEKFFMQKCDGRVACKNGFVECGWT